jgi:hypothetical protein
MRQKAGLSPSHRSARPVENQKEICNDLRVGPRSSSTQTKLSEHETNRGEVEKSERVSVEVFEIFGQATAAIKPREGAFDNPTSRQKFKPFIMIGAFDDFDLEVRFNYFPDGH